MTRAKHEEGIRDSDKRIDDYQCPFCELYWSEIGIKNCSEKDALYFSIHAELENHQITRRQPKKKIPPRNDC
jgi:hypothetical protein